ncbi:MAG: vitamin K epoxide reductase family protein [Candidatus Micrarchaeia archaeon]
MTNMRVSKKVFLLLILMSLIGLISAITVLYEFQILNMLPPFCTLNGNTSFAGTQINCAIVLKSTYSNLVIGQFKFPLELLAAIWFIINIGMVCAISFGSMTNAKRVLKLLFGWRFFGILIVPYLIYLEFFVVHSICIYCTIMHAAIIIDFIIVSYFLFSKNSKKYIALDY